MKKILIIRFRHIGDAVISSTLCTTLKQSIPDAEIHFVLNEGIASLFKYHPDIDKIITFNKREVDNLGIYVKKIRKVVKEGNYDIIIDLRSTTRSLLFSLFSLGSKYRIGRKKSYNRFIHNYRIENRYKYLEKKDKDIVELTLALAEPLKKEYDIKPNPYFKLYYTEEEYSEYRRYMEDKGIDFSKPVILCAVATRLDFKAWPQDKMQEILQRILNKYDVQLVFNYGNNIEKEIGEQLHRAMNNDERIFSDIEADDLRKLLVLVANSSFFFGNEGGVRHIAHALDIPAFAIYPPITPIITWLPNRSDRFEGVELGEIDPEAAADDKLSYQQKLSLIDVESVWTRVDKMFEKYL